MLYHCFLQSGEPRSDTFMIPSPVTAPSDPVKLNRTVFVPFSVENKSRRYTEIIKFYTPDQLFWNWGCNTYLLRQPSSHPFYLLSMILEQNIANRSKRETVSPTPADLGTVHLVPLGVPFYLSCPIASYHADYTWRHGHRRSPCLQMQSNCLHLIPVMTEEYYGKYECVSEEKGYAKVVKNYQLSKQLIPDTNTDMASAVAPQLWISLGMAVAVTTAAHAQITI